MSPALAVTLWLLGAAFVGGASWEAAEGPPEAWQVSEVAGATLVVVLAWPLLLMFVLGVKFERWAQR